MCSPNYRNHEFHSGPAIPSNVQFGIFSTQLIQQRYHRMLLSEGSYFIIGGAGFIGSHFVDTLLASKKTRRVTIFDNFSSGRDWHYEAHLGDSRLNVVRADASDLSALS